MERLHRILVAEDEPDIRAILKLALENLGGYEACVCPDGKAAIEKVCDFMPQLIILDVMMPGMDGLATLAALRRIPALKQVPVVFMTAKNMPDEILNLRAAGAADVIAKPFNALELPAQLRHIWQEAGAPSRPAKGAETPYSD